MSLKKLTAAAAVAFVGGGVALAAPTVALATTSSPYTVVLWQVPTGADPLKVNQPYVTSAAGTSFDAVAGAMKCGTTYQVDIYRSVDEHGKPVSSLWSSGSLKPNHDGGFLAYDLMPKPYEVLTTADCVTPPPTSTPTPTAPVTTPPVTQTPEPTPTHTPPVTETPKPTPTTPPVTETPKPTPTQTTPPKTEEPKPTPTATSYVPESTPDATQPAVVIPIDKGPKPPTSATVASPKGELAFTGVEPWMLPAWIAGGVAMLAGFGIIIARTIRARRGA